MAHAVMLQNVVDLNEVCGKLTEKGCEITQEKPESFSAYMAEHIKRVGDYVVDIETRPKPLIPRKIIFARAS